MDLRSYQRYFLQAFSLAGEEDHGQRDLPRFLRPGLALFAVLKFHSAPRRMHYPKLLTSSRGPGRWRPSAARERAAPRSEQEEVAQRLPPIIIINNIIIINHNKASPSEG